MAIVAGILLTVTIAWVIYGVLSLLGIGNAGNVAAYAAMGLAVFGGLYFWLRDEVASSRTKRCPDCAEEVQPDARLCKHCGYRFDEYVGHEPQRGELRQL